MNLRLIILVTLLLISNVSNAQDRPLREKGAGLVSEIEVNDDLKTQFAIDMSNYFKAFNQEDWEGVIDMVYPKLFDLISKDQMIQLFIQIKEMGMDMKLELKQVDKISEIINYENSRFCRVYYNGMLTIGISGAMLENKDQLKESFIAAYGLENVKYDSINEQFDVNAKKSMMAIASIDSNNWTYMEYNEQQEEMLYQLIPKEVLDQLLK